MVFQPGNKHGGSKRGVCGRKKALQALDAIAGKEKNIKVLTARFQKEFTRSPMIFWRNHIMPLLPKQSELELSGGLDVEIKAIVTKSGKIEQQETEDKNSE